MKLIRSFISLNIDSSLKNRLRLIQNDVKDKLKHHRVKWEEPEKFHLTLQFLGDVDRKVLDDITQELSSIKPSFDSFIMTTSGIGFFPNRRHPNVIFISLDADHSYPQQLTADIEKKLEVFGFRSDKEFVPHITIGRFRRESRQRVEESFYADVEPIEICFNSFYLMKSTLGRNGSVHEVYKEFKFKK